MRTEEREGLRRIRHAHWWFWGIVSLYAPVLWIVVRHTNQHRIILPFTVIWGVVALCSALRVAFFRCPRCREYFHSAGVHWSLRHLSASRCLHCGLSLRVERVIYPSME